MLLKMIRNRVVAVFFIFYVLMFFQCVSSNCEYQALCSIPNTTYDKRTLSCRFLNRTTVATGNCDISPVTKGYLICSDAHNVTEQETHKHCQMTNLQVNPCGSYPTDGSFGLCKSGSYGEISGNHPSLITPTTILNNIIPTLSINGPTQDSTTPLNDYVTTTSGTSNKQPAPNHSNSLSGVIVVIIMVVCAVLFVCWKKFELTKRVKPCLSKNINPSSRELHPGESERFAQPSNINDSQC